MVVGTPGLRAADHIDSVASPFGSYGPDLLGHKVADRFAEEALFFGEFEIQR